MTVFVNEWDSAGELSDWTDVNGAGFSVSGGELVGPPVGVGNNVLLRNGLSPTLHAFMEIEADTSADGGMVLRFVDNDNHYLCAVRDGSSSSVTLQIYRKEGGSYNSLAQAVNLGFTRGTVHTARFEVWITPGIGQRLRAFFDGVLRLEAQDDTWTTGGIGLRTHSQPTRFRMTRGGDLDPAFLAAFEVPIGVVVPPEAKTGALHNGNTFVAAFPAGGGGGATVNPTHGYATTG